MAAKKAAKKVVKKGTFQKEPFPPSALADLSLSSARNFLMLVRILKRESCVLSLGAGVSVSSGIPQWDRLLQRIASAFFQHWPDTQTSPPRDLSIAFAHAYFHHPAAISAGKALACGDPLLVAQQIKNCLRDEDWVWLLRRALYDDPDGTPHSGTPSPLIEALSRLCGCEKSIVSEVITYNYDDLLERCLSHHGISNSPVAFHSTNSNTKGLHVYHPHGYRSTRARQDTGGRARHDPYLIFTEAFRVRARCLAATAPNPAEADRPRLPRFPRRPRAWSGWSVGTWSGFPADPPARRPRLG